MSVTGDPAGHRARTGKGSGATGPLEEPPLVVAFDIDDTITRCPRFFSFLTGALRASGHTVLIVTHRTDRETTEEDLRGWGIPYDHLILWSLDEDLDMDRWKATVCRRFGVQVLFEDHVPSLRHVDPGVLSLLPFEAIRGPLSALTFDEDGLD